MAKNKTQPKIEAFLKALSQICHYYGMLVDANGGGKAGAGPDRGESRFLEGAPLVLYAKSGLDYRKIGHLYYSFVGENEEHIVFNFSPKEGLPYTAVELAAGDVPEFLNPSPDRPPPPGIESVIEKAKKWNQSIQSPPS